MSSQDRFEDGEKKHKVWYIEGRGVCALNKCPKGHGKDFSYEVCKDCVNFRLKVDEEITDWEPTM